MYAGEMVELASMEDVFSYPPSTLTPRDLSGACPKWVRTRPPACCNPIPGMVPPARPEDPRAACSHPAAVYAPGQLPCSAGPKLRPIAGSNTLARCHWSETIDPTQWKPDGYEAPHARSDRARNPQPVLSLDKLQKY